MKGFAVQRNFDIPSLDGIRAIAVSLVFLAHAGLEHVVPGGFGVTIFFFLSGYLITTLLRREYEKTGRISLKNFYLRRVYRIFPPMYIVLALVTVLTLLGVFHGSMRLPAVISQLVYMTNYYGIFHGKEHFVPLTSVYWSLAVEEHFYLVFPLLLGLMVRRLNYRKIALVLLSLCLAVLLWRLFLIYGIGLTHHYTYKATDTRIDSILYGCVLGMWWNPALDDYRLGPLWVRLAILAAAGSILLFCLLYRTPDFRQTWRYSLQGIALFPIFILAVRHSDWPLFRWLNTSVARWIGILSYTFYLSHMTGLALAGKTLRLIDGYSNPIGRGVLGFLYAMLFSWLMYALVERRFARLRRRLHVEGGGSPVATVVEEVGFPASVDHRGWQIEAQAPFRGTGDCDREGA